MDKTSGNLIQRTLGVGLGLPAEGFAIFKDYVSGLEFIRPCRELVGKGLFVLLGAYQCHVFLDWRLVSGEQWQAVYETLNGAGVPSIQAKFDELFAVKEETIDKQEREKKRKGTRKRATKKPAEKSVVKKTAKSKPDKSSLQKKVPPKRTFKSSS